MYNVAQWNGTSWGKAGTGVKDVSGMSVEGLLTYDSILYASGQFDFVSGKACKGITQWNGTMWDTVGPGLLYFSGDNVECLATYNNEIYAGGNFTIKQGSRTFNNIARWNGIYWDSVTSGLDNYPSWGDMVVFNGKLYVAGYFTHAGGVPANYIASWDGTKWDSVGSGLNSQVFALTVFNGALYVGGGFTTAGGKPANCIAKWDGTSWSALGTGITGGGSPYVNALGNYNGYLIAGGEFTQAGGKTANDIAAWNGSNWYSIGSGFAGGMDGVIAIGVYDSTLYAGGDFTSSGATKLHCIAQWKGPVGVDEVKSNSEEIKVYPNPSNGIFTFRATGQQLLANSYLEIYNMLGQQIAKSQWPTANSSMHIDLSGEPAGIYFYRITSEKGELIGTGKLVIQ